MKSRKRNKNNEIANSEKNEEEGNHYKQLITGESIKVAPDVMSSMSSRPGDIIQLHKRPRNLDAWENSGDASARSAANQEAARKEKNKNYFEFFQLNSQEK